jgi:hypothetical protein
LLATPPGQAALFAASVVFGYLLLSGRRLGPPLAPADAAQGDRAMYEHVQALAGLYRRAGQLAHARRHFSHYYRRRLDHAPAAPLALQSLAAIERAQTDSTLIAAVNQADDVLHTARPTRHGRYATLTTEGTVSPTRPVARQPTPSAQPTAQQSR